MNENNEMRDNQPIDAPLNENKQENYVENLSKEDELYEFKKVLDELNAELNEENDANKLDDAEAVLKSLNDMPEKKTEIGEYEAFETQNKQNDGDLNELKNIDETKKIEEPKRNNPKVEDPKTENAPAINDGEQTNQAYEQEFKDFKYLKMACRLDYDLTDVNFSSKAIVNECAKMQDLGFNSVTVLPSKLAYLKKVKKLGVKVTVAIGYPLGEASARAKIVDMRKAKWQGASGFEISFAVSLLKEGKKGKILRNLARYKFVAGKKRELKVSLDVTNLSDKELLLAIKLITAKNIEILLFRNSHLLSASQKLAIAKATNGKCKVEYTDLVTGLYDVEFLMQSGAERILVKNADEISENLKKQLK